MPCQTVNATVQRSTIQLVPKLLASSENWQTSSTRCFYCTSIHVLLIVFILSVGARAACRAGYFSNSGYDEEDKPCQPCQPGNLSGKESKEYNISNPVNKIMRLALLLHFVFHL